MKVLILSHTCMDRTSNMGKTLYGYFRGFAPEELAQVYLSCQVPGEEFCGAWFRFTDKDALGRLFFRPRTGTIFRGKSQQEVRQGAGWAKPLYRFGSRRTALGYALRELLWRKDPWDTGKFWAWAEKVNPDVVFFASGDYGFSYRMAEKVAQRLGKPLVVACVDDHYLQNRNGASCLGRMVHSRFLHTVRDTMDQAAEIYVICQGLAEPYEALFAKPCRVLHTPAAVPEQPLEENRQGIAYLGNLELGREDNLVQIGRALRELEIPGAPKWLDVYSADRDPGLLKKMCRENGIRFHGAVSAEEVARVMGHALALVHTESFLPQYRQVTRHSVSAKIPDILMAGPCLLAYGPEEVASMEYLQENRAAWCITEPAHLAQELAAFFGSPAMRQEILDRARQLGRENHGQGQLRGWLEGLCQEEVP